jgi:hypothetical protein
MPAPALSVVICTHNPRADYFGDTLAGLRAQSLPAGQWELVVIDNRSAEPLAGRTDLSWHPNARILREETLGLTPARLRGIAEAAGELLVFVDDDNVLDPDFLEQALRIARERPHLGAWSGQCRGRFEEPPPEWTRRYWGNLVIRQFDTDSWSNLPRLPETMPCGAGLCVRGEVARHYLALNEQGRRRVQLDRTGDSLMSGGDNDLAACACDLGLGVGLCADLKLQHLIPPGRFTEDYLTRLAYGIHYSAVLLDADRGISHAPRGLAGRIADRLRLLTMKGPDRAILKAAQAGERDAVRALNASAG